MKSFEPARTPVTGGDGNGVYPHTPRGLLVGGPAGVKSRKYNIPFETEI